MATIPAFVPAPDAPGRDRAWPTCPQPEAGPAEALVIVEAYSVNRGELFLLEAPREDWRPGQDVAGHVERTAADGSGPAQGTRVVAHVPAGGWAPLVAAPTDALAMLPDDVAVTAAATLGVAGLTALRLLRTRRQRGRQARAAHRGARAGSGTSWPSWPPPRARS